MPRVRPTLGILVLLLAACGEGENLTRLRSTGEFEPATLEFGEVGVNLAATRSLAFRNTGQAPFQVTEVVDAPSFIVKGLEVDTTIPGGQKLELEATYLAVGEGSANETMIVRDRDVEVQLTLNATGVIRNVPLLEIVPENGLDFGVVEVGRAGQLTVAIDNKGNAPATIESVMFAGGTTVYSAAIPPGIIVAEGIRGVFRVTFSPDQQAQFVDQMILTIAEVEDPVVVPLRGEGGDPVGAVFCNPPSLPFDEIPRGQTTSLDVTCTARGSPVTINSVTLVDEMVPFRITPPGGIPGALNQDASIVINAEFVPDALPGDVEGAISIKYSNERGETEVQVPLVGRIGPPPPDDQAISVTLRWDKNNTDVDIHLIRPEGSIFDRDGGSDCHYANKDPDWGTLGDTTDNPFLDVDDVDGFGPETINLARAGDGTYDLKAHYFKSRGNGPIVATADIFIGGTMVAQVTSDPLEDGDIWELGSIEYAGGTGTFSEGGGCTCAGRPAPAASWLVLLLPFVLLRRR